ncbi:MAG: type IV pilus assembly protein PilM [Elusimicrobiota bacterium]
MLGKIFSSFSAKKDIAGLDVGSSCVKVAIFSNEKSGKKLKTWGHIPYSIPAAAQPEERKALISEEISKFFKKMGIQTKYVASSVSGNSVIVRYVKLPKMTKKELDLAIKVEAEPFIPFDVNDIYLSYHILNDSVQEEGQQKMEVVIVAAKKEVVNEKIEIITGAGLEPAIIDVDSFALENLYSKLPGAEKGKSVLLVNMGNKTTNLSIIHPGTVSTPENPLAKDAPFNPYSRVVRDIFISGASLDRSLSKILSVTPEQAQEFKKGIRLLINDEEKLEAIKNYDKQLIVSSKAAMTIFKDMASEISRSIDFYLSQGMDHSISRIYLSGGLSATPNLCAYLSGEFKIPVELMNPFSAAGETPKNMPADIIPSMAVACGLGLRELRDWQ